MRRDGVTVDTSKFNAMVRELAKRTGAPVEKVIDAEATAIMEQTLKWTKAASVSKIVANQAEKEWITVNGKRMRRSWRMAPTDWTEAKRRHAASIEKLKAARGLSKRQVANMAGAVGLMLKGTPAYVMRARSSARAFRDRNNASGFRRKTLLTYLVAMILRYPLAFFKEVGIQSALNRAIKGRVKFFRRNVAEGVFRSTSAIAGKYGAVVRRAA